MQLSEIVKGPIDLAVHETYNRPRRVGPAGCKPTGPERTRHHVPCACSAESGPFTGAMRWRIIRATARATFAGRSASGVRSSATGESSRLSGGGTRMIGRGCNLRGHRPRGHRANRRRRRRASGPTSPPSTGARNRRPSPRSPRGSAVAAGQHPARSSLTEIGTAGRRRTTHSSDIGTREARKRRAGNLRPGNRRATRCATNRGRATRRKILVVSPLGLGAIFGPCCATSRQG
jgi:hypothetical protein